MNNTQLYIFLTGTTVTGLIVLLNYFQQKKKQKHDEEQKNEYIKCRSLSDFEQLAKKLMLSHRFYYYNYKSGQGHTYQSSRDYFNKQLRILPRVLIDVTQVSLKTTILGCTYDSPIIIAPTAFHRLAHPDGEVATARGASEAQCIYTYNWVYSTMAENEVLLETGPKYFHIYLTAPIDLIEKVVPEVEKKGYQAIVVTCDDPTDRVREHILPLFMEASNNIDPTILQILDNPNVKMDNICMKPNASKISITWTNIIALRKLTKLPIICKGILSPVDAELAIKYGVNGIVVSNHGGRLIDTAVPAIECLEDIINIVDGRVEVFVDTGIRSGTDVLKALALGARAVFIGRPILYGLACGGHNGVRKVLEILKQELIYDMASYGLTSIDQINKEILYKHA